MFIFIKTKSLLVIFIVLLTITLASGLVYFLTEGKSQPVISERAGINAKQVEMATDKPVEAEVSTSKDIATPQTHTVGGEKKIIEPEAVSAPAEEKIKAAMMVSGAKYETEVKAGSSVYDFMSLLKEENKIDFSGKNYAELGFFVEEINGLKNNPAGENWIYYVNGQPAQIGVSNYIIKVNDIIEWRHEVKSW